MGAKVAAAPPLHLWMPLQVNLALANTTDLLATDILPDTVVPLTLKLLAGDRYDAATFARDFGRRHSRRPRTVHLLNAHGTIEDQFTVSVQHAGERKVRIICDADTVTGDLDCTMAKGTACSVGAALPHFTFASPYRTGPHDSLAVFITNRNSERVPELLASAAFSTALSDSALEEGDCLQTVSGVGFRFVRPSHERVEAAFRTLGTLATAFPPMLRQALPARFPSTLRPIASSVLEWGLLDPGVRAHRIAEAHPDALRRLIASAQYHAERIDRYLLRTRYPESPAALVVRGFVEAASLARIRLERVAAIRDPRRTRKAPAR